ncbi:hypothetical protein TNCV_137061 [Trichonephila clavipes]|nr:hypothetical protein TNCV_137061 [Trichonephila clavipes]
MKDEIGNLNEEIVYFSRQISLKKDSDVVQKLLDSYNQELTIDDLTEMHETEQEIEQIEYLDPVHSEAEGRLGIGQIFSVSWKKC